MQGYKEVVKLLVLMMLKQIVREYGGNEKTAPYKQQEQDKETESADVSSPREENPQTCLEALSNLSSEGFDLSKHVSSSECYEALVAGMNVKDSRGCTGLHICVLGALDDLTQFLLALVVEPFQDSADSTGLPGGPEPEHGGVVSGRLDVKPSGGKRSVMVVDSLSEDGKSPLHMALSNLSGSVNKQLIKIIELLLRSGANPNLAVSVRNEKGTLVPSSPLLQAIKSKNFECVRLLLQYGAEDDEEKVMKAAVAANDEEIIGCFLKNFSIVDHEIKLGCGVSDNVNEGKVSSSTPLPHATNTDSRVEGLVLDWNLLGLKRLCRSWFEQACHVYHTSIKPSSVDATDHDYTWTITRIDLSCNNLCLLNAFLLAFRNLKKLDVSNNKVCL